MAKPSPKLCAAASLPLLGGLLWLLTVWLILPTLPSSAQFTPTTPLRFVTADPTGACTANLPMRYNTANGKLWGCDALVWTAISGGGSSYPPNTGVTTNRTTSLVTPVTLQTTGNCCTDFAAANLFTSQTWVQQGPTSQIRQTGDITALRFSWANPPGGGAQISAVYFQLWRNNPSNASSTNTWVSPGNLVMVAQSANIFSSLTNGAINTVTLATPIHAQIGDYYGFSVTGTFTPGNHPDNRFFSETLSGENVWGTVGTYGTYPTQLQFALTTVQFTNKVIPVDVIMSTAPVFVTMGDSIFLGSSRYPINSPLSNENFPDITSPMAYYLSRYTGLSGMNVAIGGQTSAQMAARFATDVVAHSPRLVIIQAGLNDINSAVSLATFQASWTSMLTAARAANIIPVCLLITPWGTSNAHNQTKDTWNQWLTGQCEQYGGYTVDPQPYVGVFHTGGTVGNLWDIRPEYVDNGDQLTIHFRPEGSKQLAQAVIDRLGLPSGFTAPKQLSFGTQAFLSQTASIASTNIQCYDQSNAPIDVCEPGMYRVSIYMLVNVLGAGATVVGTFGWLDPSNTTGGTLRTQTVPTLTASALNFLSQTYTVALGATLAQGANNPNLTFSAVLAGGSATYSVYITAERIGGIGY